MSTPYIGDFVEDFATITHWWDTVGAGGQSITRETDGTIKIRRDDGTDCTAGAVTDTEDTPDVGIHEVIIDASGNANIIVAHDYLVWLDGGTVDGQPINKSIFTFSVENRPVNVTRISNDSTAADDLELLVENCKGADHKVLISSDAQDLATTLKVWADVREISEDAAAADNLEAYYDGTRPVLYVGKSGNDANDGSGFGKAFLTIGAAAAAASDGDELWVGPGTFDESLDFSSVGGGLSLAGIKLVLNDTTITNAAAGSAPVLKLGTEGQVCGRGSIVGTSEKLGLVLNDDVRLTGISVVSDRVALKTDGADNWFIDACKIQGSEYGISGSGNASRYRISNSLIITDGAWTACRSAAIYTLHGHGVLASCLVRGFIDGGIGDVDHQVLGIQDCQGLLAVDCQIVAVQGDDGDPINPVQGSHATAVKYASTTESCVLVNCKLESDAASDAYDLTNSFAAGKLAVFGTQYDAAKTSGTITDLDERSVANVMDDALPGSPTADSINERLKTLDDDWANDGRLDAILDARMATGADGDTGETLSDQIDGVNTVVPDAAGVVVTALGVLQTHGDGTWATAAGFLTQANIRTAVGLAAANLDTQLGDIPTASATATAVWTLANAIAGKTPEDALRYIGAMLAGIASGAGTGNEEYLDFAGDPAVDVTADIAGNRSAMTYHP